MNWIDKILKKSTAIAAFNKEEDELIQKLIDKAICHLGYIFGTFAHTAQPRGARFGFFVFSLQ